MYLIFHALNVVKPLIIFNLKSLWLVFFLNPILPLRSIQENLDWRVLRLSHVQDVVHHLRLVVVVPSASRVHVVYLQLKIP